MYGPVAGTRVVGDGADVPDGTMSPNVVASFWRKLGSAWVRWKVTVDSLSSTRMPRASEQVVGERRHVGAPIRLENATWGPGRFGVRNWRSMEYRTSEAVTNRPLE